MEEEKKGGPVSAQAAASQGSIRTVRDLQAEAVQTANKQAGKTGKPPVYLGINVMSDREYNRKLKSLFVSAF